MACQGHSHRSRTRSTVFHQITKFFERAGFHSRSRTVRIQSPFLSTTLPTAWSGFVKGYSALLFLNKMKMFHWGEKICQPARSAWCWAPWIEKKEPHSNEYQICWLDRTVFFTVRLQKFSHGQNPLAVQRRSGRIFLGCMLKKQEQGRRRGWGERGDRIPKWCCQTERCDDIA